MHLAGGGAITGIAAPYDGWFEGTVLERGKKNRNKVLLKWSDPRVDCGAETWLDLRGHRWLATVAPGALAMERHGHGRAWLEWAADQLLGQDSAPRLLLARWWAEARWGLVRVSVTPTPVYEALGALHEARRFVAARSADADFWESLSDPSVDVGELGAPPMLEAAVLQARARGARRFLQQGIYLAASPASASVSKKRRTAKRHKSAGAASFTLENEHEVLYSLILWYPLELIGFLQRSDIAGPLRGILPASRGRGKENGALCSSHCDDASTKNCVFHTKGVPEEEVLLETRLPVLPLQEIGLVAEEAVAQVQKKGRRAGTGQRTGEPVAERAGAELLALGAFQELSVRRGPC